MARLDLIVLCCVVSCLAVTGNARVLKSHHVSRVARSAPASGVVTERFLPETMAIKDFEFVESGRGTNFETKMSEMTLVGMRNMKIERLLFNLDKNLLEVRMSVPTLRLAGKYAMEGSLIEIIPLKGAGDFWLKVSDVVITVTAPLHKGSDNRLALGQASLNLKHDDVRMNFAHLNKNWASETNSLLSRMDHLIFEHVNTKLMDAIQPEIQSHFDSQIERLPSQVHDSVKQESALLFNELLDNVRNQIRVNPTLDPLSLPDEKERFSQNLLLFKLKGDASLTNGVLTGLSTLARIGDVYVAFEDNKVVYEAEIDFENLAASYDWALSLMDSGPSAKVSLHPNTIKGFLKLTQGLRAGDRLELDTFRVNDIKNMHTNVSGMGAWNFVFEMVANLASRVFKNILSLQIAGPMRDAVREQVHLLPNNYFTAKIK